LQDGITFEQWSVGERSRERKLLRLRRNGGVTDERT
jgi:hypothetical protein